MQNSNPKEHSRKTDNSNKKDVYIAKESIRNMIVHVLRFSNDKSNEIFPVMGLCLGQKRNNQVQITRAIPIKHGDSVDEPFTSKDTELFRNLQNKFEPEGIEIIGWYRSHPLEGVDLNDSDIVNQAYFQRSFNKNSVCLVFDHSNIEFNKSFGFSIYRINDLEKTNDISTLNFGIELPNTLDYYKWVKKFVEDFHKKKPLLIKEVTEISPTEITDLQEIPGSSSSESSDDNLIDMGIRDFQENFDKCVELVSNRFNTILKSQIKIFIDNNSNNILKSYEVISDYISQLKESSYFGFPKIKAWFEEIISNSIDGFESSINNALEDKTKSIQDFKSFEADFEQRVQDYLTKEFKQNVRIELSKINKKLEDFDSLIKTTSDTRDGISSDINQAKDYAEKRFKNLNTVIDRINNYIIETKENSTGNINNRIDGFVDTINQFEKVIDNLNNSIVKLKKLSKEFKKI